MWDFDEDSDDDLIDNFTISNFSEMIEFEKPRVLTGVNGIAKLTLTFCNITANTTSQSSAHQQCLSISTDSLKGKFGL